MRTFTVGITIRNDREGLDILLPALAAQTRLPDEVIVVDAASTDGTREAAEAFAARAPFPVRVESFACTRGAGRARIVELAKGDVVAFTDADCEPPPGWLEGFASAWRPGDVALGGPNRSPEGASPLQRAVEDVMAHTEAASFHGVNTCNAAYDREALLAAGNFADLQVAEDPDMNARLAERGGTLRRVENMVWQRRRATWGALLRQHFAYGKGAWHLLQRHPGYFPRVETLVGPALLVLALLGIGFAVLGLPLALLLFVPHLTLPWYVHRRLVAAFWRAHGSGPGFWRRLGVLWVAYVPYHSGMLVARLARTR